VRAIYAGRAGVGLRLLENAQPTCSSDRPSTPIPVNMRDVRPFDRLQDDYDLSVPVTGSNPHRFR
jgi:hypothetical protein